ncbi:uncharacterized protein LOC130640873 [Hydractinia symbiolongicarpus]|nr:uncharacterized protein LOC130640873 [Hydractinia symbiolongicarpus]
MTGFIVWCFMSYVVSFFNNIQTDIDDITDVVHSSTYNKEQKFGTLITHKSSSKKSFLIENGVVNTSCPNFKKIMDSNISLEDDKVPKSQSLWNNQIDKLENDKYRINNSSSSEENIIQPANKNQTHVLTTPKIPRKRRFRRRSKTAPSSAYVSHNTQVGELSVSDSEMKGNAHTKLCRVKTPNIVVVIDNSNIFIGAREAACHEKSGIRPRHVKLKLIQLLHIAEEGRKVTRGIAGASSPTTTSAAVWDIYRRSGYSVDLEDRRGKDEQRVDEQLHLAIYRALVELPAQTLVIATGDGNKGKSRSNTSFVECAKRAIYLGWKVEVLSWRHCLSVEWLKMANEKMLKIKFLDEHIHQLTSIEKRQERRSP